MEFAIPAVPAVLLLLLQFIAPYFVSLVTAPKWPAAWKKVIAIVLSFVLSALVIVIALWAGWISPAVTPAEIVTLAVVGLLVQQAAYSLLLKPSADALTKNAGVGTNG